ncbi:MAG TPA: hypothetical protein VKA46_23100 [Gemmataceae bacterium]|nr:hypothetical protein [Gemmataceae bacterium]
MSEVDILDDMIRHAQSAIDQLRAQLQGEERYLAELCKRRQASARAPGVRRGPSSSAGPTNGATRPPGAARIHSGSVPWHVLAVLEDAGREMDLADIARAVEARGLKPKKPGGMKDVVYASLRSRLDLFERIGAGTYDLKSRRRQNGTGVNGK